MKLSLFVLILFPALAFANERVLDCATVATNDGAGPIISLSRDAAKPGVLFVQLSGEKNKGLQLQTALVEQRDNEISKDQILDVFLYKGTPYANSMPGGLKDSAQLILKAGEGDTRYNPPIKGTLALDGDIFLIMKCQ